MEQAALEAIDDRLLASWDSGDADAFLDLPAEDFVWYDWTSPEPIRDLEAARAYFSSWTTAIPDMKTTSRVRILGDDSFATEIVWTGTNSGPFATPAGELPATGRSVTGRGTYFAFVRDGKVAEFRSHPDVAGVMAQLGVGG
jgi:steroid delta-isomerase-like uncharacterized protein